MCTPSLSPLLPPFRGGESTSRNDLLQASVYGKARKLQIKVYERISTPSTTRTKQLILDLWLTSLLVMLDVLLQ